MVAEYLQDLLVNAGLPAYIGALPTQPDNSISVYEFNGGFNTEYFTVESPSGLSVTEPVVKILARNSSYAIGQTWVEQIAELLNRYHDDTLMSVLMVGSPFYLGRGETKLHEFQVTFKVMKKE